MEQMAEIEYLGAIISAKIKPSLLPNHTIVDKKEINNNTKMIIYKMVYHPTLFYGSES